MLQLLTSLFSGGLVNSIEGVAKEWIETSKDKAEAATLMLKTLDPNGIMRRQISIAVTRLYTLYILVTMVLVLAQAFKIGDVDGVKLAITSMTSLFMEITGMFTLIVGASFGVNTMNAAKGV